MLRLTMPRLFIGLLMLLAFRFQGRIKAREHAPSVALVDLVLVLRAEDRRGLDVALGIVVVEAGFRVDPAYRADHLAGEQDVIYRDYLGQQVDTRLVINAGVEEDIVQQVILQQRLFQLLRQTAEASPVIGHRAAAMRNQEFQPREVLEQVRGQALHEGRGVGVQVMRAGGVKAGVAAGGNVDHGGDVELHHLLVDRVPLSVRQRRRGPVPARRVRIEVDADATILLDAFLQLRNAGLGVYARRLRQHRRATKLSGNSWLTRQHSSLQIAAQVDDTLKSPIWCAMKLARGLKMVRSLPRSCS